MSISLGVDVPIAVSWRGKEKRFFIHLVFTLIVYMVAMKLITKNDAMLPASFSCFLAAGVLEVASVEPKLDEFTNKKFN